jgi:hypothetical protein
MIEIRKILILPVNNVKKNFVFLVKMFHIKDKVAKNLEYLIPEMKMILNLR